MSCQKMNLTLLACLALLLLLEPTSCRIVKLKKIKGCKELNTDGTCRTCNNGLVLLVSQGTCAPRPKVCPDGRQRVFGLCLTITNCANRDPHGVCRISSPPSDPDCISWNWGNQRCLGCANGKQFSQDGICAPRDLTCADGKQLVFEQCLTITNCADRTPNGLCRISYSPSDPYCGTWDWDNQVCLVCMTGKQFSDDGICVIPNY